MFNNPFREEAMAASESRQQLDRLLRVTAPHERLILAVVGLVLAVALGWLVFGGGARDVRLDGVLLTGAGEHRLRVGVSADPRVAQRLGAGMEATVGVGLPGGGARRLEGVVGAVVDIERTSRRDEWAAVLAASESTLGVDIELLPDDDGEASDLDLPAGTPCQLRIVLARQSPASLLLGRGHF